MTSIESVIVEVHDVAAAEAFYNAAFYNAAFGLGDKVRVRASEAIAGSAGPFTDPDGFTWDAASA